MTSPTRFQVAPDQIRTHANAVGDIADQLSGIATACSGGLSEQALGTFVQFLTAGLQDAMTQTTAAIGHASSVMHSVRAGLASSADHYQHTDDHSAAGLRPEAVQ